MKNLKTSEFRLDFFNKSEQSILLNAKNIVVGFSGGIDSTLALAATNQFLETHGKKNCLTALHINHQTQSASSKWQKHCEIFCKAHDINFLCEVVQINETGQGYEAAARSARLEIFNSLEEESVIILGHHLDDQAETIFMRSSRNSGIDGLSGMKTITFWNGIFILRPLLKFSKNEIVQYANYKNIKFYEDPSNYLLKYERVRIRQELNQIKNNKWKTISNDLFKLGMNCNKLLNNINIVFENWLKQNILVDGCGVVRVNCESLKLLFKQSDIFCVSLFSKILLTVGGKSYPPKRKKVCEVIKSLLICDFKKRTLGNVCISLKNNFIYFLREKRHLNYNFEIKKNKKYIFDRRYIIISNVEGKLVSSEKIKFDVVPANSPFYEFKKLINATIPCLQTLEGKLLKPHLNIIDTKLKNHGNLKYDAFKLYLINRVLI
jgi:tRNA(Ile)-lysidine synthetase-like protein